MVPLSSWYDERTNTCCGVPVLSISSLRHPRDFKPTTYPEGGCFIYSYLYISIYIYAVARSRYTAALVVRGVHSLLARHDEAAHEPPQVCLDADAVGLVFLLQLNGPSDWSHRWGPELCTHVNNATGTGYRTRATGYSIIPVKI